MTAESPKLSRLDVLRSWLVNNWLLALGLAAVVIPTMVYVAQASWSTEQGAHGPIVLATGIWLLMRQWPSALEIARPAAAWRVFILFSVFLALWVGARITQIVEIEGFVMYGLVLTVLYSGLGAKAMARLWFPLFYLAFVFPPPDTLVTAVTQPLKIALSVSAVDLLYLFGYPIASSGVSIQVGQYQVLVAEACAGLNSLLSLSAISLFYIFMRRGSDWRYSLVLLLTVFPVAVFANFVRVVLLILLTFHGGEAMAQGFLHNFAGITMFATALISIFALDTLVYPFWCRITGRVNRDNPEVAASGHDGEAGDRS